MNIRRPTLRSLCLLLTLVLLTGLLPLEAFATCWKNRSCNFIKNYTLTGNQAEDIVAIAEAQLGQTDARFGYKEHWCADFVSDCAYLAGAGDVIPGSCAVRFLHPNILNAGGRNVRWEPRKGDIIFYDWVNVYAPDNHVEIVTSCSNGRVYTIGGNNLYQGVRQVARSNHALNDSEIQAIIRPNYPGSHTHSYCASVTPPTCTQRGFTTYTCSCGDSYVDDYVPALGHDWDRGTVLTDATCTHTGLLSRTCRRCGAGITEDIPRKGHDWQEIHRVAPTCQESGYTEFRCRTCGETRTEADSNGYSPWSDQRPQGVPEDQIETRIQYRHSDRVIIQDVRPQLPGCTQERFEWEKTGTKTLDYVREFPSGFSRSHPLFNQYYRSPLQDSVTDTEKVTVTGTSVKGWIYWHWCQNSYAYGPINRFVNDGQTAKYPGFHAFYSTTAPGSLPAVPTEDGLSYVYNHPNGDCCKDTYWYYALEVSHQTADVYRKLYTHSRWTDWSDWSTSLLTASDSRRVETRTVYRQKVDQSVGHSWDAGRVTLAPTENSTGIRTYTCTVCGRTRTETIPKLEKPVGPSFTDVRPTDYFYDSVMWAVDHGITSGVTPTTFAPGESCTRAQAVSFLWRAAGCPQPSGNRLPFTDVPAGAYYHKAVLWALENGITSGITPNQFGPNTDCTRGQIVSFLWRSRNCPQVSGANPFVDVFRGDYYYNSVLWAVRNGITAGMTPYEFWPNAACTRGQIVSFLCRAAR